MTSGTAARRGGKGPRVGERVAGTVAGEPEAVSQNLCEEYSTVHYIIFIYTKISSDLAENTLYFE